MQKINFSSTKNEYLRGVYQNPQDIPAKYEAVDCDFTDELEFLVIRRVPVELKYWNKQNLLYSIHGRVIDIYIKDHEEFIKMSNDTMVRLDRIASIHILNQ